MRSSFHGKRGWSLVPWTGFILLTAWFLCTSCGKRTTGLEPPDERRQSAAGQSAEIVGKSSARTRAGGVGLGDEAAERRPDGMTAADGMPESASALANLIYQHAVNHPALACEAYRRLAALEEVDVEVTQFLAAALANYDPEEALRWSRSLPQGPHRKAAMRELCVSIAPAEPAHAADLATLNLPLDEANGAVFIRIAAAWARLSPQAAANWAGRFPEGKARTDSMRTIFAAWEPAAAAEWAAGVTDPSLRAELESLLSHSP